MPITCTMRPWLCSMSRFRAPNSANNAGGQKLVSLVGRNLPARWFSKTEQVGVRAAFMRGGTSRALVFNEKDLSRYSQGQIDRIILAALGSPDPHGRQVDGLGGGISSLSKVCLVSRATGPDAELAEVTYRFGQVEVRQPAIDWSAACGNIGSAAAHFAILEGLVAAVAPETHVRILDKNTAKVFVARVPVNLKGEPLVRGDYEVPGVPGYGAKIIVDYKDPAGTAGAGVLPTSLAVEVINGVPVSIVDSSIVCAFVDADKIGLGDTLAKLTPADIDMQDDLMRLLEEIRQEAGVRAGIASRAQDVPVGAPKVILVSSRSDFTASSGEVVKAEDVDLIVRPISVGNAHRTIPGTAAMCSAVASCIPGTVVHEKASCSAQKEGSTVMLRIGHAAGMTEAGASVEQIESSWVVHHSSLCRSARLIMQGEVLVPVGDMEKQDDCEDGWLHKYKFCNPEP